ncbi:MAG: hypothetical protein HZB51_17200 [Chloroflexi bacterium]|nr:hypothetical protein [Chloroflexota bacterium]
MNVRTKDKELTTADLVASGEKPTETTQEMNMPHATPSNTDDAELLMHDDAEKFRTRWTMIQANFVDEPRRAVEEADTLVAELMKRLAEVFADERSKLEGQWGRGDNVSTEDLRITLQRYRSFFNRLLSL